MPLAPPRIHAPELAPGEWLNTAQFPLPGLEASARTLAGLRGRAVLVDFWDFTCLNCLRTLPYLTAWHRAYRDLGAYFIGIHTPEFEFARDPRQVTAALRRHHIEYPVLLDNKQQNWDAFANRYWPTVYLIDARGYLRYQHSGEGSYAETEAALAELVREATGLSGFAPSQAWPQPVGVLRAEDDPGAACYRVTPELHAGYHRGALGNAEGYLPRSLPALYRLPPKPERQDGYFYAEGTWQAGADYLALAGEQGSLVLPYHAATANAVLAPSADPVDLLLDLKPPITVRVTQDGQPLDSLTAGDDVLVAEGQSTLVVDAPRMYALARNPDARPRELRLDVLARGLALYAWSFSSCVVPVSRS